MIPKKLPFMRKAWMIHGEMTGSWWDHDWCKNRVVNSYKIDDEYDDCRLMINQCSNHWLTIIGDYINQTMSGWWFGCHLEYFPRNIGLLSSSQLTNLYFSEGWPNHQPDNDWYNDSQVALWYQFNYGLWFL